MSELVEWLKAQLDEDERIAQAASEWPWTLHPEGDKILRHNDGTYDDWEDEDLIVVETMGWSSQATRSNGLHVIRWEPSRVVQDIAAKRAILTEVESWTHVRNEQDAWYSCSQAKDEWGDWHSANDANAGSPCDCGLDARKRRILGPLASAYSHRPGYLPEWAPT